MELHDPSAGAHGISFGEHIAPRHNERTLLQVSSCAAIIV